MNLLDMSSIFSTLFIIGHTLAEVDWVPIETLRLMASVASCLLVIKIYDWLRLFETTSFYIQLVTLTIGDIGSFMILFSVALFMIAIPISIMNLGRTEDSELVLPFFSNWFIDGILNQYMLSLGEFGDIIDNSDGGTLEKELVMMFFLIGTFFTQITMLNMLIAIMGDSFDRAMDNKERYGIQTKLEILSSQASVLSQSEKLSDEKHFMIVVEPQGLEGESTNSWEGSINKVSASVRGAIANLLDQTINKKLNK